MLAGFSSTAALAQSNIDVSDRKDLTARKAVYSILKDPSSEFSECLYRNKIKLFCHDYGYISFEKLVKTKHYDLIVISLPADGSGVRWWDWKLVVEDGKRATIKALADGCLECVIRVEKFKPYLNEVDFVYRQDKHRVSARFRAGELSTRKSKLDPHEPLAKEYCNFLYDGLARCKAKYTTPDPNISCSMAGGSQAGHFGVLRVENNYAGISIETLDQQCRNACSTGKAMDRSTFFKQVCRR